MQYSGSVKPHCYHAPPPVRSPKFIGHPFFHAFFAAAMFLRYPAKYLLPAWLLIIQKKPMPPTEHHHL